MSSHHQYNYPPPSELIRHVTAICGERGVAWLEGLPGLVGELGTKWGIRADAPFVKGEFNFVAPAVLANGDEAVLKIAPPYERTEIFAEAAYLAARDGRGCVRLIAEDRERFAILIERIRPGVTLDMHFDADPRACVEPAIVALRTILLPPESAGKNVQHLDDWFARFERFRETEFPQDYGERATGIYDRLKRQSDRIRYLHGDFHPGNIVTSGADGFTAIDPKGLIGHVAYDIAVFLNNLHWWQKGKPGLRAELGEAIAKFARAFDIPQQDLREAAFASMVIGAWWNFEDMPEHYDNEVALAGVWGA